MDLRSIIIFHQKHLTFSVFILDCWQRNVGGGTSATEEQAVSMGLILEYMIPSVEHHTFIIIHTADCLTLIMNQQMQEEVLASGSPSPGSVPTWLK